jgi:adenine-specific DNA-methyltransferase
MARRKAVQQPKDAQTYKHPESSSPLRPDVGTQPRFPKSKIKSPKTYRYDSSLAPTLDWDNNPTREQAETLIAEILAAGSLDAAKAAAAKLKALSQPFLNWTGKAERLSFDVPTLPLFVHERLSTQAIIETLKGHKKGGDQLGLDLWGDPQHPITDQVLKAYEHRDKWVNRMILGDSLVVMNSLLEYEGLGGQVQMIYLDPPYGIKFGSNFQPFVRKRDVKHNEDEDMTREPEMVKAYRDTWDMGLHSYLSYLRDRLMLARELLTSSGSVFVQISDENLHHVRELMDEVFGKENFISVITFRKKTMPLGAKHLEAMSDFILWYGRDKDQLKYTQLFQEQSVEGDFHWSWYELPDGSRHRMTKEQTASHSLLPDGARPFRLVSMWPPTFSPNTVFPVRFRGKDWMPPPGQCYPSSPDAMQKLAQANRLEVEGNFLRYVLYLDDYKLKKITATWDDTTGAREQLYVVQTSLKVIERCILMTTDPGDLVLDPTCGSATTAYVAEQWGRRWITCDVSRVPLALARQRLLTATFPYYELKDESRGPAGGFVYKRKQNKKGEEIGGIVPHITLKSIANNEPPAEEILVDRPETLNGITRITGAFTVEATIPIPVDLDESANGNGNGNGNKINHLNDETSFTDRLLEILRKSPVLRLEGNRTITFKSIRKPAKSLSLSAEAIVDEQPVALVFGPENGAIVEHLVYQAAIEARAKHYTHLYVIGFAIHPNARKLIDNCDAVMSIPATYVQATPDLLMGDLLKNMRSSQIFSVCGLPDVSIQPIEDGKYRVALRGLDVFDPVSMEPYHRRGDDVPAWFLDTDYNGLCFHVCQAFFPKTQAWDNLKKSLRKTYEESLWGHLAGTISAPFEPGEHRQIAVKVIDERGNELLVVKSL